MDDSISNASTGTHPAASSARQILPPSPPSGNKRKWQAGRWLVRCVLALCFLVGFYLSVFPSGRALTRAVMIVPGLISAESPGWEKPVDEPIKHIQETISSGAGPVYLDIYEPTDSQPPVPGAREGMLMIPGVGDQRKQPQVVNFSETLAASGVVVMGMTTPALIANRLEASDEEAVVQAFQKLQHWPGVNPTHVGMFGISGGGGLMCLAAADARIRDQVRFVALLGSYFDATTLLQTIGQRAQTENGQTQPWSPNPYPLQVLANTVAPLMPEQDARLLTKAFQTKSSGSLSQEQIRQLAPSSAAFYHLLAGDETNRVNANLAALPPEMKELLASVSPSRVVDQIQAPVYLLHDRSDQFVPVTQSSDFAATLANLHHSYDFAEFGIFQHAVVVSNPSLSEELGDGLKLVRFVNETMQVGS
jgi:dienelactone hydrolase